MGQLWAAPTFRIRSGAFSTGIRQGLGTQHHLVEISLQANPSISVVHVQLL